jgi:hypothetical protein
MVEMGSEREDIESCIITLADTLTLEHLAQLAFNDPDVAATYPGYIDLLETHSPQIPIPKTMDLDFTIGSTIAINGGMFMVAVNHYLLYKCSPHAADKSFRTINQLVRDTVELNGAVKFLSCITRVGDDLVDFDIDLEVHAPNLFVVSDKAKKHFLDFCLLGVRGRRTLPRRFGDGPTGFPTARVGSDGRYRGEALRNASSAIRGTGGPAGVRGYRRGGLGIVPQC